MEILLILIVFAALVNLGVKAIRRQRAAAQTRDGIAFEQSTAWSHPTFPHIEGSPGTLTRGHWPEPVPAAPTTVPEEPSPCVPGPVGVPTFKVVALGLAGSGKTVLLGSMFHKLNFPMQGRSYYLETHADQQLALSGIYRTLSDTDQGWPRATRVSECTEYLFDCIAIDADRRRQHVLSLSYLDYAGDLLENAQDAGRDAFAQLNSHIFSAQTLLGMLDGQYLVQLLRNEPAGHNYFEFEVRTMIGLLQKARCPIHLVISKWDLVRDFGEPDGADDAIRLEQAVRALKRFDHFNGLVDSSVGRLVRIIPVSAVGPVFAQMDSTGTVVKRRDGQVHPRNVEVPLCAVVPDLFRQVERQLDDEQRRAIDALRKGSRFRANEVLSGVAAFFTRPAGVVLRVAMAGVAGGEVGSEVSRMFVEWAARPYANALERRQAILSSGMHEFNRSRAARERVLADFEKVVHGLEQNMPGSELR
jgi:hypothetical protein